MFAIGLRGRFAISKRCQQKWEESFLDTSVGLSTNMSSNTLELSGPLKGRSPVSIFALFITPPPDSFFYAGAKFQLDGHKTVANTLKNSY